MFWILPLFLFLPYIFFSTVLNLKKANSIGLLILVILFLIFSFNNGNQDYIPYLEIFENPEIYGEVGYLVLVNVVKYFGGNHAFLLLVIGSGLVVTVFRAAIAFRINMAVFCLLYFVYPFIYDITQLRNTIMFCCVLNGFIFIYRDAWNKGIFFIILGCFFHNFGLIYLLVALIYKFFGGSERKLLIIGVALMFVLPIFFAYIIPIIPIERVHALVYSYFSPNLKFHSLLIWGLDYFLFIFIASYLMNYISSKSLISVDHIGHIRFLFKIILIHVVFLGFLVLFFEFNRVYRNLFLIRYFFIIACFSFLPVKVKVYMAIYMYVNALAFLYLSSVNLDGSYTYGSILSSNHLLNIFKLR